MASDDLSLDSSWSQKAMSAARSSWIGSLFNELSEKGVEVFLFSSSMV